MATQGLSVSGVGPLLRRWRSVRRLSQLELALQAGVSARHLSFLETGRAQPSREMVLLLAGVLGVPLREQNGLLQAAGYASFYRETPLDDPQMAGIRQALELNKPLFNGEDGILLGSETATTAERAAAFDQKFAWHINGDGMVGELLWTWHNGRSPV